MNLIHVCTDGWMNPEIYKLLALGEGHQKVKAFLSHDLLICLRLLSQRRELILRPIRKITELFIKLGIAMGVISCDWSSVRTRHLQMSCNEYNTRRVSHHKRASFHCTNIADSAVSGHLLSHCKENRALAS